MAKVNPTGIRFGQKASDLKKRLEMSSYQKLVNFLVERYWWENEFKKEQPLLDAKKNEQLNPVAVSVNLDAPIVKKTSIKRSYEQYVSLIKSMKEDGSDTDEWVKLTMEIDSAENLNYINKNNLKAYMSSAD